MQSQSLVMVLSRAWSIYVFIICCTYLQVYYNYEYYPTVIIVVPFWGYLVEDRDLEKTGLGRGLSLGFNP